MKHLLFVGVCAGLFALGVAVVLRNLSHLSLSVLWFSGALLACSVGFAFASNVKAALETLTPYVLPLLPWHRSNRGGGP